MLECVINISEGREISVLGNLRSSCSNALLDIHSDAHHNRSVFTLGGPHVEDAARELTRAAVRKLDLTRHHGVHPRFGIVDVVPFTPVPNTESTLGDAQRAQLAYAEWVAKELGVPAFLYGNNRSLPELRRLAFDAIDPDFGPIHPHPTAGAIAVGARDALIAYNLWLRDISLERIKTIAKEIRNTSLRTLALDLGNMNQVSCNLVNPFALGPKDAYDLVAHYEPIDHAELVGLIPRAVLETQPRERWNQLDLSENRTVEYRLDQLTS